MQEIKQQIKEEKKERERRRRRIKWQKKFADDPINLRHLPKHVVKKAWRKIQLLRSGAGFRRLDAKRMQHSRNWIRIKLGNSWRLMARDVGDRIVPVEVLQIGYSKYGNVLYPRRSSSGSQPLLDRIAALGSASCHVNRY
jgi:hypothetical protein